MYSFCVYQYGYESRVQSTALSDVYRRLTEFKNMPKDRYARYWLEDSEGNVITEGN